MTTHYLDIALRDDPQIAAPHLLGALYDRLHLALVQQRRDDVGISFPGHALKPRTLGTTLRLHGSEAGLQALQAADWLRGMRDHVRVSNIAAAPADAEHRTVQRRQFKTSAERLRRRRMRRKGETAEQAAAAIPSRMEHRPDLPYVHLHSQSTHQPFCLFIDLGAPQPRAINGVFNTYGLSGTATVPWF
ncbi:MAG: type I-F CRISPR-associated endoribonuclease Cas6/Csy4 [Xanthomonadales bacterium]|nr:type I-F CRISPR-associated endoribonuclease Cas6/Csy4 [Xanthomonadales bacterium]ODU93426.1 MAG: type I-F CRISPR-associated endoribonuclease Cas6/Csy4 [Rhodanobacter sp. SCN 66-43]OJY83184.1 MAG: type I-F CRISPR-associated endoribonuclease Cas6/Csy4 [Xanthomonadales bacterium 66-474]